MILLYLELFIETIKFIFDVVAAKVWQYLANIDVIFDKKQMLW